MKIRNISHEGNNRQLATPRNFFKISLINRFEVEVKFKCSTNSTLFGEPNTGFDTGCFP